MSDYSFSNSSISESEYDEESFDNESIEEISDNDESISEILSESQSEDLVQKNYNGVRLGTSDDKLSHEKQEHDEDNELSNLNSIRDDNNAVLDPIENQTREPTNDGTNVNEHEVDESDSDDESVVEIVENIQSLDINTDKIASEPINTDVTKHNDDTSTPDQSDRFENSARTQSDVEFDVRSQTPSSFNSDNHAFHMDIIPKSICSNGSFQKRPIVNPPWSRNSNRKSLSFSNERLREIERHNQILLRKILTKKPRKENSKGPNVRVASSSVNRKKQQRQIDLDNQILKKKIEAISVRRRP